jgi:hypothetical protein
MSGRVESFSEVIVLVCRVCYSMYNGIEEGVRSESDLDQLFSTVGAWLAFFNRTVPWKPADIGPFYSAMPCSWSPGTPRHESHDYYDYTEDELPHEDNNSSGDPIGHNTEPISTSRVAESQNIIESQCIVLSAPWIPSLPCETSTMLIAEK